MRVYVHGATRSQGANIFESVIYPDSFESVFRMDTVKGVHVCACMSTVQEDWIFYGNRKW